MTSDLTDLSQSNTDLRQELFDRLDADSLGPKWLLPVRKSAVARFADAGFPTTKQEDWRFTDVSAIKELALKPVFQAELSPELDGEVATRSLVASVEACRLVFVDGVFQSTLSSPALEQSGVFVKDLKGAFEVDPLHLQEHLTRYSESDQNAFTALNTAYFTDGAVIKISKDTVVDPILHLVFVSTGREDGMTIQPRNLVTVERGASVTMVEEYLGLDGGAKTLTNSVTEFVVGENARVEHVKIQDETKEAFHIGGIYAQLDRCSHFRSHSLALGAKLSRNNIRTKLNGEGLACVLNGLYLTNGTRLADHHMVVEHAKPHCESHEYFNGILDDESRGVFHGRILVQPQAQKTDAKQTNKNLLLSDSATANTKPQLEIYADDVKCTHGATIGQMDEEAIFYLRTRGVPHAVARRMLMHAFAGEIIERIESEPLRECLDKVVLNQLEA